MVVIALQSGDKTSGVAAAKMVLPRIDPVGWGSAPLHVDLHVAAKGPARVEDLPQHVLEALTPEQLTELAELERVLSAGQARVAEIIDSLTR